MVKLPGAIVAPGSSANGTCTPSGGGCVILVEAAEFIVWSNDRRRARLHPDPYAGLADDELSPLQSAGQGKD